jgi:hypothetical protein
MAQILPSKSTISSKTTCLIITAILCPSFLIDLKTSLAVINGLVLILFLTTSLVCVIRVGDAQSMQVWLIGLLLTIRGFILVARNYVQGIDLRGADFSNSNLEGADFTGANLRHADFTGATTTRAIFDRADLRDARFTHQQSELAGEVN